MEKMLKVLNKKGIAYISSTCTPTIIAKMIHPTIKYEVEFLIQFENGIYTLLVWCNDWHFETLGRKTPKSIVDNMERIMKGLPRRLDSIRMAQWEEAMNF